MHNFTRYNEERGWNKGDELLKSFAEHLKSYSAEAKIFRIHGDDFVLICQKQINVNLQDFIDKFHLNEFNMNVSYRIIDLNESPIESLDMLETQLL